MWRLATCRRQTRLGKLLCEELERLPRWWASGSQTVTYTADAAKVLVPTATPMVVLVNRGHGGTG